MAINKVIYGNTTLMDLTSDTATEDKVMSGYTFHDASGTLRTGTASGTGGWMPHLIIYTETNSTVVIEKGQTSITATETSTGVFEADLPEYDYGIYTITTTFGQDVKTIELDVDTVQVYELTVSFVPNGSTVTPTDDIQIWLACAEIRDKSYTTLAEVLADTNTYQLLLANSNACDYMARSTTWALAEGSVPTMTSNTTPTGYVASGSHERTGIEPYYQAFDDNYTNSWSAGTTALGVGEYIDIELPEAICVSKIMLYHYTDPTYFRTATWELFGSNDGTNWTSIKNDIVANQANTKQYYFIGSTTPYKHFRMKDIQGANYNDQIAFITELQLYSADITTNQDAMRLLGKYDYACDKLLSVSTWKNAISNSSYFDYVLDIKIPTMTGYTTPSGTAYANSEFRSPYLAWKTFNGVLGTTNDDNRWVSAQGQYGTNAYLSYDFGESVCITKAQIYAVLSGSAENPVASTLYIEGSNDNDAWTSITSKAMTTTEMSQYTDIDLDYASYRYYRAYFSQCNIRGTGSDYYSQIRVLQLYGRHESSYVSGKVAIHGANNSSIYYKDGGSDVIVGTTDIDTGIASVNVSNMPLGTYALYDGVAKNPSDLTADYSKTVTITRNTTDVWLMPDNTLYWWGYESSELENMTSTNGWSYSGITFGTPSRNTTSITLNSATKNAVGIGSKNTVNAEKISIITQGVTVAWDIYGFLTSDVTKSNWGSDVTLITNASLSKNEHITTSNKYAFTYSVDNRTMNVYAFWYE